MELLISSHPQTIVVETTGLATGSQSYRVDTIMFLTALKIHVSTWLKSEFIKEKLSRIFEKSFLSNDLN